MNIYLKIKSVGKRRPILENTLYTLPDDITTLRQLIETVVRQEVEKYNNRGIDNMLVPFLTESEISDQSTAGKIGFGRIYSDKKADFEKAVETALQGFEDGLFRIIIGDMEATELDEPLTIHENDILTFIRLTFLAGRLW
ncbi:MAG TPA: hypothetical protein DHW61_17335 [Lachnoclostridium phytofermentans]|uniref:Uncharacterized protein n=1 Tax=Lachnoclostridium phytofermentans TaxID=66219 RepID=A0A3D2XC28_9FIRM|nr:hypothetical protein [Lachnoclostridium sp.]HCL04143.1 hypothetical protein [Lachnoclostridium phytofermentans]